MKYSIIIPCYNEEANLERLVGKVVEFLDSRKDTEFILVENGSKDGSRQYFEEKITGKYERLKTVYVDNNQGYGYGMLQGVKEAAGDYIGWIHADIQVEPKELHRFFEVVDNNPGKKIFMKGTRSNRKFIEYFFTFGMGLYETMLFGHRMRDVLSLPVLFNREVIIDNYDNAPYDFMYDVYVYVMAVTSGCEDIHLPVRLQDRIGGESSWNKGLSSKIKLSKRIMNGSKALKKDLKNGR